MTKKATVPEKDANVFTVRVPDSVVDANGQRVECFQEIRYRSDRGNDVQMLPAEYAAFCDLMLDKTIRWTSENSDTTKRIKRDAALYVWWNAFIQGPLGQVPIGSDDFRQSRAGLIHPTFLNSIRRDAKLSPADFKSLSLAEVFAVIEDIHCREHNEENRRQKAAQRPTTIVGQDVIGFTKNDLCRLTGYADTLVNQRLKSLDIKPVKAGRPRKGCKPFSKDQVQKLLQSIIDDAGAQQFNKDKCSESLNTL